MRYLRVFIVLCLSVLFVGQVEAEEGAKLGGFGSILYVNQEHIPPSFKLRAFHLYVSVPLEEKFTSLAEVEFEDGAHLDAMGGGEGEIMLHRFWINWKLNENSNLKIGRDLNPASGPYTLIYAHPLLPTAIKPLKVNRGRLPQDVMGIQYWGNVLSGDWEVAYWLGADNGLGPTPANTDTNNNKTIYGRVQLTPPLNNTGDLKVGLVGMSGEDGNLANAKENGAGADVIYSYEQFQIWGEWFKSRINPPIGSGYNADSFFIMGLYRPTSKWIGAVRYEENDKNSSIQTTNFNEGKRWVVAINYKPVVPVLFGLEYIAHEEEVNSIENNAIVGRASMMF